MSSNRSRSSNDNFMGSFRSLGALLYLVIYLIVYMVKGIYYLFNLTGSSSEEQWKKQKMEKKT